MEPTPFPLYLVPMECAPDSAVGDLDPDIADIAKPPSVTDTDDLLAAQLRKLNTHTQPSSIVCLGKYMRLPELKCMGSLPGSADANGFAHGADGTFFQPGDLGLGDANQIGYLHLGLAVVKAQGKDLLFPVSERLEGGAQGNPLHPVFVGVFGVTDLIHNSQLNAIIVKRAFTATLEHMEQ